MLFSRTLQNLLPLIIHLRQQKQQKKLKIKRNFHHTYTLHIRVINKSFLLSTARFFHSFTVWSYNERLPHIQWNFVIFCFPIAQLYFYFVSIFLSSLLFCIFFFFWRKLAIHTENVDQGHENIVVRKYIHSHFIYRIEFSIVLTLSCKGGNLKIIHKRIFNDGWAAEESFLSLCVEKSLRDLSNRKGIIKSVLFSPRIIKTIN